MRSPYLALIVCHQKAELYQRELLSFSDGFASNMLNTQSEVVCAAPCPLWVQQEIEYVRFFDQYWC